MPFHTQGCICIEEYADIIISKDIFNKCIECNKYIWGEYLSTVYDDGVILILIIW